MLLSGDTTKKAEEGSALKSKVAYTAVDSITTDVKNEKAFLYNKAEVNYETFRINAGYIEIDLKNKLLHARGIDSAGTLVQTPVFSDEGKIYQAQEITYNYETKKGKIKEMRTQEGDAYINMHTAKKDSSDVYYVKNGIYTTCNANPPHYGIHASKLKVIRNDKIVTGPAYLEVAGIPTPLGIPFGFFPNKSGRKSGILVPYYGESALGYFLRDGGYYFGLSDHFDLALRGDIYSKGSWGVKAYSNYVTRYRYSGRINIGFSQIRISEPEFPDYQLNKDFFVVWNHTQDAKANPSVRFSANVNVRSATYNKYNSYNPTDYLSNTYQSNVSWSKSWRNSNFSANLRHSQNTINRTVDVSLPELAYSINRFYPFKRKEQVGSQKWYEKIGMSYTGNFRNDISSYDYLIFKEPLEKRMKNGIKHSVPVSASFNAFPFTVNPSLTFNSYMYAQTIRKTYSVSDSAVKVDTVKEFRAGYDYTASLALTTKLYGMYAFSHSKIKAIRHVITPSFTFSYRPDFSGNQYGFYGQTNTTALGNPVYYSYFEGGIFGAPPSGKSGLIGYNLNNNLEMKLRPARNDTSNTDRKVTLIDNFIISQTYNLAADHFQWSPLNMALNTKLIKKIDITAAATLDPYEIDSQGTRIEKFVWNNEHKPGRLTSYSLSWGTSLRSKTQQEKDKKTRLSEDQLRYLRMHPDYYVDFNVPWTLGMNYNVVYSKPGLTASTTQSITVYGDLNVTSKWKVAFRSGYDLVKHDYTFTSIDVYRDLHCWEMSFNWIPIGFRKSYNITIKVKSPTLEDLKLVRKRDWYDYN